MTATAVVEILVLGLQTLLCLGVLAVALMDGAWRDHLTGLKDVKEWAPLITLLAVASAYGLGVVVDRCADTLFRTQDSPRQLPAKLSTMRLAVLHSSEGMAKFLEYQRSRLRIARGMVVNVALGTIGIVVYLWSRQPQSLPITIVIGVLALVITWYAAGRINKAYVQRLSDAYELLRRNY